MRGLIMNLFENEKNIKEEEKKGYFNCLKNPLTHKTFIKVLNKLRTNSSFKRTKDLILLLGQSFIIILEEAEKKKDFWAAKIVLFYPRRFITKKKMKIKIKLKYIHLQISKEIHGLQMVIFGFLTVIGRLMKN